MAKHLLFLLHGMGDYAKDWGNEEAKLLKELYIRYEIEASLPFDETFEVKTLFYNDKFDDLRKQWAKAAADVLPLMKASPLNSSALTTLVDWAGKTNKKEFLYTHVLDVALYRFFPQVAQYVRRSVQRQILKALVDTGATEWSVIAHSLGTAVFHDTLLWMFTDQAEGSLPSEQARASVIAMVANVSRLLEDVELFGEAGDAYTSLVQPNVDVQKGACNVFINARHRFDPIPEPKKFKPAADWPDADTRADPYAFQDIALDVITDVNVHDFSHYMNDPKLHIPIFRSLTSPDLITEAEEKKANEDYLKKSPLEKFKKNLDALKAFRLSDEEGDWQKILSMIHAFRKWAA